MAKGKNSVMVLQYSNIFPFLACNGSPELESWRERSGWSLGTPKNGHKNKVASPWHSNYYDTGTMLFTWYPKAKKNWYQQWVFLLNDMSESVNWDVFVLDQSCCLVATGRKQACFFPPKEGFTRTENSRDHFLARSSSNIFHWSHTLASFLFSSMKERKIILHPKNERGKASGNNQDLIGEAYCKSAKNLTAALVRSAWALWTWMTLRVFFTMYKHTVQYCENTNKTASLL